MKFVWNKKKIFSIERVFTRTYTHSTCVMSLLVTHLPREVVLFVQRTGCPDKLIYIGLFCNYEYVNPEENISVNIDNK